MDTGRRRPSRRSAGRAAFLGRAALAARVLSPLFVLGYLGCTLPILNDDPRKNGPRCPVDPIFGLPAPLLFAHRGGAAEVPESTILGFCHAKCVGADVLELDVRLTRDDRLVVWHGPELHTVRLGTQADPKQALKGKDRERREIGQYRWVGELEGNAWVSDPNPLCEKGECELKGVRDDPERGLITLEQFLDIFRCEPLNVEIKDLVLGPHAIGELVRILDQAPPCPISRRQRTILVAAGNDLVLAEFRRRTTSRYPTNIPFAESLLRALQIPPPLSQPGRAFQVPRPCLLTNPWIVSMAHRAGSAVHVFITGFFGIPPLDASEELSFEQQKEVLHLLDAGVDGIMTDRPTSIRPLIDTWLAGKDCASPWLVDQGTSEDVAACRRRCIDAALDQGSAKK